MIYYLLLKEVIFTFIYIIYATQYLFPNIPFVFTTTLLTGSSNKIIIIVVVAIIIITYYIIIMYKLIRKREIFKIDEYIFTQNNYACEKVK